jgi:hypothetical protein
VAAHVRRVEWRGRDIEVEHKAKVKGDNLEGEMELLPGARSSSPGSA